MIRHYLLVDARARAAVAKKEFSLNFKLAHVKSGQLTVTGFFHSFLLV